MSKVDWFVTEGVMLDYLQKYAYPVYKYTRDNFWYRLLLLVGVLLPTQIERRVFLQYLNPRLHIEFVKASIDECTGKVPLLDYAWNASFFYKWTYMDLELWRPRWYVSLLSLAQQNRGLGRWLAYPAKLISRAVYVGVVYGRFWWALFTYPQIIGKRCGIFYSTYLRRRRNQNVLPEMIRGRTGSSNAVPKLQIATSEALPR